MVGLPRKGGRLWYWVMDGRLWWVLTRCGWLWLVEVGQGWLKLEF